MDEGFYWDLLRGRLGVFINSVCPLCYERSTGYHIIKCDWVQSEVNKFIKAWDKLNKENNRKLKINPLTINYNNELNTEIVKFVWAIWKTYAKNVKLNGADNWMELQIQHSREITLYKLKSAHKKIPTVFNMQR